LKGLYESCDDDKIAHLLSANLKVTYLRSSNGSCDWSETEGQGWNHAKLFIIDDICYYVGSQDLYVANLADWGIIIDDEGQTHTVIQEYWNSLWASSYVDASREDFDVHVTNVVKLAQIQRQPRAEKGYTTDELAACMLAKKRSLAGVEAKFLTVWIIRGSGIRGDRSRGCSDVYVKLKVLDGKGQQVGFTQKTSPLESGNADPYWNEQFDFEGLIIPEACTLKMLVKQKDSSLGASNKVADWLDKDGKLGSATISLGILKRTTEFQSFDVVIADGWFSQSRVSIAVNTLGQWGS